MKGQSLYNKLSKFKFKKKEKKRFEKKFSNKYSPRIVRNSPWAIICTYALFLVLI